MSCQKIFAKKVTTCALTVKGPVRFEGPVYGIKTSHGRSTPIGMFFPQPGVGYIDPINGDDTKAQIGTSKAFKTIQAFLDAAATFAGEGPERFGSGDVTGGAKTRKIVTGIAASGVYDEEEKLDIDVTDNDINLGPAQHGTMQVGSTMQSVQLRVKNNGPLGLVDPCFALSSVRASPFNPFCGPPICIFGDLDLGAKTASFCCGVEVMGNDENVAVKGDGGKFAADHCCFRGKMDLEDTAITAFLASQFYAAVAVRSMSLMRDCLFEGESLTISEDAPDQQPPGIASTTFPTKTELQLKGTTTVKFDIDSNTNFDETNGFQNGDPPFAANATVATTTTDPPCVGACP